MESGFVKSGWQYSTSSGIELTAGKLVNAGMVTGSLTVTEPSVSYLPHGGSHKFAILGAGMGVGVSLLPASITSATESMPSTGGVYVNKRLGRELKLGDFERFCTIYSYSAAIDQGKSITYMYFGSFVPCGSQLNPLFFLLVKGLVVYYGLEFFSMNPGVGVMEYHAMIKKLSV
jgi:hypothetical protein